MSEGARDAGGKPPLDGGEELKGIDQAMLSALLNSRRDTAILSSDQERLLDDWMDDRLPPADAARAADLAKNNAFAAERILEHRLLSAAGRGPPIPEALNARILKAANPPAPRTFGLRWPAFSGWQWSGLGGAMAVAAFVAIVGVQQWRGLIQQDAPIQVAMATVGDRSALFEASDVRMRGAQSSVLASPRFRDVEIPTGLLKQLIASAAKGEADTIRPQDLLFLENSTPNNGAPMRVVVDAALAAKVNSVSGRDRTIVRVYDLQDPQTADVRSTLGALPFTGRLYFLTLKP